MNYQSKCIFLCLKAIKHCANITCRTFCTMTKHGLLCMVCSLSNYVWSHQTIVHAFQPGRHLVIIESLWTLRALLLVQVAMLSCETLLQPSVLIWLDDSCCDQSSWLAFGFMQTSSVITCIHAMQLPLKNMILSRCSLIVMNSFNWFFSIDYLNLRFYCSQLWFVW